MDTAIFAPMLGMFVLTIIVWTYMYAKRIPFITRSNLSNEEMTPLNFMQIQPPDVANPSDNLKNLFEMPVLFYALILYLFVTQQVDQVHVICAWSFFILRVLHSIMHCTINVVVVRFGLYAASSLALFVMVFRAIAHFPG